MNVFEYSHYKSFLKDNIAALPKKGRGEINRIAEHLGAHPTLISQVLNGDRDFSAEQIYKIANYLGLQSMETDYLVLLLQYERAGTADFKKYYKIKLDELRKSSLNIASRLNEHKKLSDYDKSVFYSSWVYLATWLFCSVGEGQRLDSIAQRLSMTRAEAGEILNFLKNSKLCAEGQGLYKMQDQHIHLEFGSPFLPRHHANWRIKSLQRTEDLTSEEMMFTSPFSISSKDFLKIREELIKVIKSTSSIIKDSPAEDVACLNVDLFWIKK